MMVLTAAMARDLRYAVALHQRAGDADALRTGRALARRGLVRVATVRYSNRRARWTPTLAGLAYVDRNFRGEPDPFREEAHAKVTARLAWQREIGA
jgi:hypothetical protein